MPESRAQRVFKQDAQSHPSYVSRSGRRMDAVEVAERYIAKHDRTLICNLNIDDTKITPFWAKVSTTPFEGPALMRQGYGREMKKSFISIDAPRDSFIDPEKVPQPSNRMDDRIACVTRIRLNQRHDPHLASQVLPMGESLQLTKQTVKLSHTRFRSFPHDKRTYLDPLITERDHEKPIEWGPIKRPVVLDTGR